MKNNNEAVEISGSEYENINEIRGRLADSILICIVFLGAPLIYISFLRYLEAGGFLLLLIHSVIYLSCIPAALLRKKITLKAKAHLVIGCAFLIAATSIVKWGIIGSGVSYFIFCSILVTIFYGAKPGVMVTIINLIIMSIAAVFFDVGHFQYNFDVYKFSIAYSSWISTIAVYGCFTLILVVCLSRLYLSMFNSIEKLESRTSELKSAKEQMETEIKSKELAEKALRESEERFRTVLENLPCGVSVHDLDGRLLMVNEETCRVKGYSREELLELTVMETAGPSLGSTFDAIELWQKIETGTSFTFETLTQRKDGSLYDSEVHLSKILLEGQPVILSLVFDITERKKAEEALKKNEMYLRILLSTIPDMVCLKDVDGRFLFCNSMFVNLFGGIEKDIIGKTDYDFLPEEVADSVKEKDQNTILTGKSGKDEELIYYESDGHHEILETVRTPMYSSEGELVGVLSIGRDITERKKMEDALERRSELERLVSEISSGFVGMRHYEIDTYIDDSLAAIGRKTGVDHAYLFLVNSDGEVLNSINEWCVDETVPKIGSLKDVDPEKDMPWFAAKLQSQEVVHIPDINKLPPEAQKEKTYFLTRRIKSLIVLAMRQGETLMGLLGFDNIYEKRVWSDDEIVILRIIGETFSSALQRRNAEKEQERLQAQLSTAVELAHLGPWELDIENEVFTFNDQFYKIYHTTAQEMGGYTMSVEEYKRRFVHPDDVHLLDEIKREGMKPGASMGNRGEHRMLYADGKEGYIMAQAFRITNSKGIPVKSYGVNQDITEWKIAQKKLHESEEKLARAKKMESLGLLAGGVAHDLNNVLSGIVSYPELILLDLPEDSKLRKPIETIQESGNKAVAIVQDLLTIARGAATTKAPLNLNTIINEYLNSPEFHNLKYHHPAVKFKTDLEDNLFNFHGSLIHIKKVIMNLVSNASEAIENHGNVTVSTRNQYIDTPLSKYEDVKAGEYVVLSVLDDGPGIARENLDRIFEPFFTKKVMGISGTGLGLTVVWNTVQDHSGYIDVKSDKNGTIFELYFPITREELKIEVSSVSLDKLKGNGQVILVVDDVASQREISCRMLESLGYRYVAVSSGEEAIEYLKSNRVDLVLLDMIMAPGMSGRETYEQIVKINPGQKAVIISGYTETEDVLATQKLGAGRYVKKPFTLQTLGLGIKEELIK